MTILPCLLRTFGTCVSQLLQVSGVWQRAIDQKVVLRTAVESEDAGESLQPFSPEPTRLDTFGS